MMCYLFLKNTMKVRLKLDSTLMLCTVSHVATSSHGLVINCRREVTSKANNSFDFLLATISQNVAKKCTANAMHSIPWNSLHRKLCVSVKRSLTSELAPAIILMRSNQFIFFIQFIFYNYSIFIFLVNKCSSILYTDAI